MRAYTLDHQSRKTNVHRSCQSERACYDFSWNDSGAICAKPQLTLFIEFSVSNRALPLTNSGFSPQKATRNRIPRLQKLRIVQKSCLGISQTEIAKTEGISRESVNRIVNHSQEAEQFREEMRARWLALAEPAIECLRKKLESGDEDAADFALTILASIGVIEAGVLTNRSNSSRRKLLSAP
jgi:transposase-like protein